MPRRLGRRPILAALAMGTIGTGISYSSQPALAADATDWSVSDTSIESDDGTISGLTVPDGSFAFSVDWRNISDVETPVEISVSARISDSEPNATEFEDIASGAFKLTGETGSATDSEVTWSDSLAFPMTLIDSHSDIEPTDFEAPTEGTTETTAVDIGVEFSHPEVSDSFIKTFEVAVTNPEGPTDEIGWVQEVYEVYDPIPTGGYTATYTVDPFYADAIKYRMYDNKTDVQDVWCYRNGELVYHATTDSSGTTWAEESFGEILEIDEIEIYFVTNESGRVGELEVEFNEWE